MVTDQNQTQEALLAEIARLQAKITTLEASAIQLKDQAELFHTLVRNLPEIAVLVFDRKLRFLLAEGDSLTRLGYNQVRLQGRALGEILAPKEAERLMPYYQAALGGIENVFEENYGDQVYLVRALPLRNTQGEIYAGMLISQEVTRFKRAEAFLSAEKERMSVTMRSIGDAVITTNLAGNITLVNRIAEQLTGWSQAEVYGQPIEVLYRVINARTRQPLNNPVKQVLQTGQNVETDRHSLLIRRDGSEISVSQSAAPILDQHSQLDGAVLVFRDRSEQQRIDAELSKASKLETLTLLAGGIAHDFNNLLTAMLGNLSLGKIYTDPNSEIYELLEEAEKAALRSKDLASQLLAFTKGGTPFKKATALPRLIQEATQFALHGANVKAEYRLAEGLWPVEVDEGQFSQVIHNLVLNAVQAMPQGGTIHLQAENWPVGINTDLPLSPDNYVKISVQDEGSGISPENLGHIFDPYFTTKTSGNGLGLAVCQTIIEKHEGYIGLESSLGLGTTFQVYLPALARRKTDPVPPGAQALQIPQGRGRVLVMEDDPNIRVVVGRMLARLGYQVDLVANGEQALMLYQVGQASGQPFEAVLLDLTIQGGMGGKDTMRALQQLHPQAKVLVSSGYSNDPILTSYRDYGFAGVVVKPYKLEELAKALQQLLPGEFNRD